MNGPRRAYTSTVVSGAHLALGLLPAVAGAAAIVIVGGPSWLAAITAALLVAVAVHLASVRLVVGRESVACGYGARGPLRRRIPLADVRSAQATQLGWAAVLGFGPRFAWRVTRLTVRPGPTLVLALRSGERVRVSAAGAVAAASLINDRNGGTHVRS